jgi:hypothetical protein
MASISKAQRARLLVWFEMEMKMEHSLIHACLQLPMVWVDMLEEKLHRRLHS